MSPHSLAKRPVCAQCLRPERTCICHWVRPLAPAVEVLILQHPLEVHQAKGSARLLHLCLRHSRLVVGESFDPNSLFELLHAPWPDSFHTQGVPLIQPVLLYPKQPAAASNNLLPQPFDSRMMTQSSIVRLVVVDGTWRKSRKMLALNPVLQLLPRVSLEEPMPSQYTIRKAHLPGQLSTLEACCHALGRLENDAQKYMPLLQAFVSFIKEQIGYLEGKLRLDF
jgi:DTW domain-containing protein YfiP